MEYVWPGERLLFGRSSWSVAFDAVVRENVSPTLWMPADVKTLEDEKRWWSYCKLVGSRWNASVKSHVEEHRDCNGHEDRKEQDGAETDGR